VGVADDRPVAAIPRGVLVVRDGVGGAQLAEALVGEPVRVRPRVVAHESVAHAVSPRSGRRQPTPGGDAGGRVAYPGKGEKEIAMAEADLPEAPRWRGINHLALVTPDMDATVRFYAGVLGMRLVATTMAGPMRHYFFELA